MSETLVPNAPAVLAKAAANVRYLIAHLANEGAAVEEAECTEALNAASRIDSLTPQEEAAFWKSYSTLVKSVLPARIDALQYADYMSVGGGAQAGNPEVRKIVEQESRLKSIRKLSMAAFAVTLIFFAYLSIGESAMQRNSSIASEYASLRAGVTVGTSIEKDYQTIKEDLAPTKTSETAAPSVAGASSQTDCGGSGESNSQECKETDKKTRLQNLIRSRMAELIDLAGYNDSILRFLQMRWLSLSVDHARQTGPVDNGVAVTQLAVNSLISKYLLPVCAALLGVTVYILRTASADMQALSFRVYDSGMYSNRLALGVVGGIAISWFSVTDTHGIVGSITPAALAFLVGYSVEVLYNVLDSLVKALGANAKS